ncbi:homoserine kinase [unidentified eubacterium SCB49]|nr:homoserine kinase [unidentified eubacterium SCB49]
MEKIKIFAPATVANVSCGFDAMAFALENLGDEMLFTKNTSGKVSISKIKGANLPTEIEKNVAGFVADVMLKDSNADFGVNIEIKKKYKPGSGLGSSAASSAGAAYAINELLGRPYTKLQLTKFSMLGEEVACGSQIADNVAGVIYGGFVLIRNYDPLDIISIPTPDDLYVSVLHPQIELRTEEGRAILPKEIPLSLAVSQWSNVGGLISGLHTSDYQLIGRAVEDHIIEPVRKKMIPHFDTVKKNALAAGALAVGISGSGPSIFALSKGELQARSVAESFKNTYNNKEINYTTYVSRIGITGVRKI